MKRLVVGAIIVEPIGHPGRVLVGRRRDTGRWEFPGGKIERGETPSQALEREVHEELGIAITVGGELEGPDGPWPISDALELRLFHAIAAQGSEPAASHAHDQLTWASSADLLALDWEPADEAPARLLSAAE